MMYVIFDSHTGDELGTIEVEDAADDESIIEGLCFTGYLDASADAYEITDGDAFADEGERTVRDEDGPVLVLAPEDDSDDESDDNDEDAPGEINHEHPD